MPVTGQAVLHYWAGGPLAQAAPKGTSAPLLCKALSAGEASLCCYAGGAYFLHQCVLRVFATLVSYHIPLFFASRKRSFAFGNSFGAKKEKMYQNGDEDV